MVGVQRGPVASTQRLIPIRPQAPSRGQLRREGELLIASMHLCYSMSTRDIPADMLRMSEEVRALMSQAHIVVLTGINSRWVALLRNVLPTLATRQRRGDWDFRFDDEDVCILWAVESCRLVQAEV